MLEVHSAPGPPRTSVVVASGRRTAMLEVGERRGAGWIELADRSRLEISRPPGSAEWWICDQAGALVASLRRMNLLRERYELVVDDLTLTIRPERGLWRRRWQVVDPAGRTLVEVVQRRLSRTVHDVRVRSGDIPELLPLLTSWALALSTCPPLAQTRRPRWTIH